jgi:hypothetical protein
MVAVRQAVFYIGFVVAMKAMFGDVNALLQAWGPLAGLPAIAREAAIHVPYAVIAALLLTWAEVWRRLPAMFSLYPPLAILAGMMLMPGAIAASHPDLAILAARILTLLLVAMLVMVQTRFEPKPGFIYEGSSFPAVKAFIALTLLLALSIDFAGAILGLTGFTVRMPVEYANLAIGAVIVAGFITATDVRFRSLQPNSASVWLVAGVAVWAVAELTQPAVPLLRTYGFHKEPAVAAFVTHLAAIRAALHIVAHALLFVGAFSLLSHLLPERDRIARQ